jgi:CRP-like cAMP-binding protein
MQEHCALVDDVIIKQGDIGDYFYVLIKGRVAFMVDEKLVEEVSSRAAFGELALLYDAPRAATVKAVTDCILYRVDQNTFRTIMAYNNYHIEKKRVQLLQSMDIFKDVEQQSLGKIAKAMTQVVVHDGQTIFRKGDKGEIFYVIQSGKIKITDFGICSTEQKFLNPGDFFGERALITGGKRSATATAVGSTTLYCVSRESFETICGSLGDLIHHTSRKRILMHIPIFANANLEPQELDRLAKMMTSVTFDKGAVPIEEGKPITNVPIGLYVIRVGEVSITSSTGSVAQLKRDDYFGEDFFYKDDGFAPKFTVTANEMTICYVLTGKLISAALGGMDRLKRKSSAIHTILESSITLETLSKIKNIGVGTFGKVYLVMDKRSNTLYALKIQDKRDVIKRGQPNAIIRERKLMASVEHPFICKLFNCFQDDIFLYMVVEYGEGGDLLSAIDTQPGGLSEDFARFYAANVFDALMYLHGRCILFRDLKPEVSCKELSGLIDFCFFADLSYFCANAYT